MIPERSGISILEMRRSNDQTDNQGFVIDTKSMVVNIPQEIVIK